MIPWSHTEGNFCIANQLVPLYRLGYLYIQRAVRSDHLLQYRALEVRYRVDSPRNMLRIRFAIYVLPHITDRGNEHDVASIGYRPARDVLHLFDEDAP